MGLVYGGIPRNLALRFRDVCGAEVFIETGTSLGKTTTWAAQEFQRVLTIEIDAEVYAKTSDKLSGQPNVEFLLGDSRERLAEILPTLGGKQPLIWLDAHVCGKEDHDSPLLEELLLINQFVPDALVLIDDARFVLAPNDGRRLCTLDGLVRTLDCVRLNRYLVIVDDIIIAVPLSAKDVVDEYCREITVADWEISQAIQNWRKTIPGRLINRFQRIFNCPSSERT